MYFFDSWCRFVKRINHVSESYYKCDALKARMPSGRSVWKRVEALRRSSITCESFDGTLIIKDIRINAVIMKTFQCSSERVYVTKANWFEQAYDQNDVCLLCRDYACDALNYNSLNDISVNWIFVRKESITSAFGRTAWFAERCELLKERRTSVRKSTQNPCRQGRCGTSPGLKNEQKML